MWIAFFLHGAPHHVTWPLDQSASVKNKPPLHFYVCQIRNWMDGIYVYRYICGQMEGVSPPPNTRYGKHMQQHSCRARHPIGCGIYSNPYKQPASIEFIIRIYSMFLCVCYYQATGSVASPPSCVCPLIPPLFDLLVGHFGVPSSQWLVQFLCNCA